MQPTVVFFRYMCVVHGSEFICGLYLSIMSASKMQWTCSFCRNAVALVKNRFHLGHQWFSNSCCEAEQLVKPFKDHFLVLFKPLHLLIQSVFELWAHLHRLRGEGVIIPAEWMKQFCNEKCVSVSLFIAGISYCICKVNTALNFCMLI